MTTIGVLALQGDFAEHVTILRRLGTDVREVRLPSDLAGVDGLILPGGETTTIAGLISQYQLRDPIRALAGSGAPLWGTCAGLIALAGRVEGQDEPVLGLMDIDVQRNAYGRQVDSFEAEISVPILGDAGFHAVFIRAPRIRRTGPGVETLARLDDGAPVAVRHGAMLGTSFHPELTEDPRFHAYFLRSVKERDDSIGVAASHPR
ncbi:MAG: pyridoxal 5'-phosphate synthase glutaminase subunit PdxT [Dehalococcoidia bacterium]